MKFDIRLIPDYESSSLIIAPPINCNYKRVKIQNVYQSIFQEISTEIPIVEYDPQFILAPDIWIRDFAPIPAFQNNLHKLFISFIYKPNYIRNSEIDYINLGDDFSKSYSNYANIPLIKIPIVLDGGNLCHNGKTCIVTERILFDNPKLSSREIRKLFLSIGIENLIIIPTEPGDITGHTDGTIRFVNQNTLVISKYNKTRKDLNNYLDSIRKQIIMESKTELNFICLYNDNPENNLKEGIPSCIGNYINFIQTKSHIIFPNYKQSEKKIRAINENALQRLGKKVLSTKQPIDSIAQYGGSLNCLVGNF
ncbi:agmatine deiminase family protein [Leptospira sp. GIMC2001]|uniref:agmatine deiminase family protein n=1 Tax=Leptospira sp. GIMC2001 TaxID=1513297 RepID=UPI0023499B53|nr:agmatine deiminase family protein [Leptospira sp. GIMC2001]WCL48885.1 agmatine deiminase family protein [Leptospira sp. GIMC2001]